MATTNLFYQNEQVTTVKTGQQIRSILRGSQVPLAEKQSVGAVPCSLLATDIQNSVLLATDAVSDEPHAYSAYGYTDTIPSAKSTLDFNGERAVLTSLYPLGRGYRTFSPRLMRFLSPDSISPFGEGGINCYAYCSSDPINFTDPSGHMKSSVTASLRPRQAEITKLIKDSQQLNKSHQQSTTRKTALDKKLKNSNESYDLVDITYGIGSLDSSGRKAKINPRTLKEAEAKKAKIINEIVSFKDNIAEEIKIQTRLKKSLDGINSQLDKYEAELGTSRFNAAFEAAQASLAAEATSVRSAK